MWHKIKSFFEKKKMDKGEVEVKTKKYFKLDPFPTIPSALLNSADIESYVNATGMIHPFYPIDLKSSSYAVRMKGDCKWWDEKGKPHEIDLDGKKNKRFKLLPNAIAFIELEPMFYLPEYIALRFNLRIKHVYRGLLLGTGPLVDPGFEGKIFIPLHNLTSREYIFEYNEELVWFEFTKTSLIQDRTVLLADEDIIRGQYRDFPEDKKNKGLDDYLDSASKGESIISSIPAAIGETKKSAEGAEKSLKLISRFGWVAIVGVVIGIASLIISSWSLQEKYTKKVQELEVLVKVGNLEGVKKQNLKISELENEQKYLHEEINVLKSMFSNFEKNDSKKSSLKK